MSEDNDQSNSIDPLTIGDLMSMVEAAEKSGFSSDFLRELAAKGRLKAKRTGNIWLTTLAAIEEYKESRHRGKRTDLDKTRNSG
jgi:excisionase family DNA binding protein